MDSTLFSQAVSLEERLRRFEERRHDHKSRIENQLDMIAKLEAGWLDGEGEKTDPDTLAVARLWFPKIVPEGASIYPSADGSLRVEWEQGSFLNSFEFRSSKLPE